MILSRDFPVSSLLFFRRWLLARDAWCVWAPEDDVRNEGGLFLARKQLTAWRENDQAGLLGRRQWPGSQK